METRREAINRITREIEVKLYYLDNKDLDCLSCYTNDLRYNNGGPMQQKVQEIRYHLYIAEKIVRQIKMMNKTK